jgi:HEAT repeat protein
LKDEDGKVDQSAAQALIRVGPDAIPQLEKTLKVAQDPLVRREAKRALIKIQSQAAVAD